MVITFPLPSSWTRPSPVIQYLFLGAVPDRLIFSHFHFRFITANITFSLSPRRRSGIP
jgi:hypothetical protein